MQRNPATAESRICWVMTANITCRLTHTTDRKQRWLATVAYRRMSLLESTPSLPRSLLV